MRRLGAIAARPREAYLASDTDQPLSEHYLRLALEATLDIGNHLIAALGLRKPLRLADIPQILAEAGHLDPELGRRLSRATGLRNRLVHAYAQLDYNLLYDAIHDGLPDLEAFALAVGALCNGTATE